MRLRAKYKLLRRLSHGAMSKVYLVKNIETNDYFAFKVVNLDAYKCATNYREVNLLKSLEHAAIPRVIDTYYDKNNNRICIMMPYINGVNLDIYVERNGNIKIKTALLWLCRFLEIINYIHEEKIVHCDIKPANLIIDDNQKMWLIDFGSACSLKTQAISAAELDFASPELIAGDVVDYRSDIYAIGKTMIALIGEDFYYSVLNQADRTASHNKQIDFQVKFIKIISKCVLKDADLRYQTATEIRTALDEIGMVNEV